MYRPKESYLAHAMVALQHTGASRTVEFPNARTLTRVRVKENNMYSAEKADSVNCRPIAESGIGSPSCVRLFLSDWEVRDVRDDGSGLVMIDQVGGVTTVVAERTSGPGPERRL